MSVHKKNHKCVLKSFHFKYNLIVTTIHKRCCLHDYLTSRNIEADFYTETWFDNSDDDKLASILDQFNILERCDHSNGPHDR